MCVHVLGQCLPHSRSCPMCCCPLYLECVSFRWKPLSLASPLPHAVLGHLPSAPIYKHMLTWSDCLRQIQVLLISSTPADTQKLHCFSHPPPPQSINTELLLWVPPRQVLVSFLPK